MKKLDGIGALFGIFFLVVGILWLSAIFMRCKAYFPEKEKPKDVSKTTAASKTTAVQKTTYAQVYQSSVQQYKRITEHLAPLSIKSYMPKAYIIYFWSIGILELFCGIFYLLSGIFILRGYLFSRHFVFYTLMADILLKILIVTYYYYILVPLKVIFSTSNIMFTYFMPGDNWISKVPVYLTGIKLVQPGFLYYLFFYVMYVSTCFYIFSKNRTTRRRE